MTSRAWYLVAAGFFMTGVMIGMTGISQLMSTVEEMQRVAMPGRAEIVLPAGPSTMYAEGGTSFTCTLADPAGVAVALERPRSKVTYSTGSYSGYNAFDIHLASPGTYILACDAPGQAPGQFAIAIGAGVGSWIVVAVVGGLVPSLLGVIAFVVVLIKRTRQKRRAAGAGAADAGA